MIHKNAQGNSYENPKEFEIAENTLLIVELINFKDNPFVCRLGALHTDVLLFVLMCGACCR